MPNPSKNKGSRFEREIVHLAETFNLKAYRVPLSGSCKGFKGDVMVAGRKMECKKRASGFIQIRKWLQPDFDGIIIGSDREPPLVILRLQDWLKCL